MWRFKTYLLIDTFRWLLFRSCICVRVRVYNGNFFVFSSMFQTNSEISIIVFFFFSFCSKIWKMIRIESICISDKSRTIVRCVCLANFNFRLFDFQIIDKMPNAIYFIPWKWYFSWRNSLFKRIFVLIHVCALKICILQTNKRNPFLILHVMDECRMVSHIYVLIGSFHHLFRLYEQLQWTLRCFKNVYDAQGSHKIGDLGIGFGHTMYK